MKLIVFFALLCPSFVLDGQMQFEYKHSSGMADICLEVDGGFLAVGPKYLPPQNTQVIILLDSLGEFMDSIEEFHQDTLFVAKKIVEEDDSYLLMGFMRTEMDSVLSFWMAHYSKELEFIDRDIIRMDGVEKSDFNPLFALNLYWDTSSDTVLFTTPIEISGRINLLTKEVFSKKIAPLVPETNIIPRKNKPGYLISGYSIVMLDENFDTVSYYPFYLDVFHGGWLGLDVEYLTDSTLIFATHFELKSDYTNDGDSGVMVGTMTDDFEMLSVDTILMEPISSSWTLVPYFQHVLEKSIDSTYIVAGVTWPYSGDYRHLFFARYSDSGERLSYTTYSTLKDYKYEVNIKATSDGGCLMFGRRENELGNNYFYVVKLGANGLVTGETAIPLKKAPIKVYPNPTSDIITFDLKGDYRILDFELVDLAGHIVLRQKVSGHEEISTSHLPKGVYGYRLLGDKGEVVYSGKMVKE